MKLKNYKLFFQVFILIFLIIIQKKISKINIILLNNKYNGNANSFNNMNSIKKLRKVVYSVILGNYDEIKKIQLQSGYDYFLFSDIYNNSFIKTNWTILQIPEQVRNLNISRVKKQRYLKLHPHLFFQNYDFSIYIDATFSIIGDLNEFLLRILSPKYYIYSLEHPERNTVLSETFAVVQYYKEKNSMAKMIRNKYKQENFTDNTGLLESCIIIRRHNEEKCIDLMNNWFGEIKNNSHRDQLSFNYIIWKKKYQIKYIVKNFVLEYFTQSKWHKHGLNLNEINNI